VDTERNNTSTDDDVVVLVVLEAWKNGIGLCGHWPEESTTSSWPVSTSSSETVAAAKAG